VEHRLMKVAAVALANNIACMACAMMSRNETYTTPQALPA
jgi:hypothetical protein